MMILKCVERKKIDIKCILGYLSNEKDFWLVIILYLGIIVIRYYSIFNVDNLVFFGVFNV